MRNFREAPGFIVEGDSVLWDVSIQAVKDGKCCEDAAGRWLCTLAPGHHGFHAAHGHDPVHPYAVWEDDPPMAIIGLAHDWYRYTQRSQK